jgi:two-component system, NarL family, sensor kinase
MEDGWRPADNTCVRVGRIEMGAGTLARLHRRGSPASGPPAETLGGAWVAWAMWGLSLALLTAGAVLWVLNRDLGAAVFVPHLLLVPGFASTGVVVALRCRGHRIGLLLLGMGLVAAVTGFCFQYAVRALATAPGSLPGGSLMAWVTAWTWPLGFAALAFVLLLFPDGCLPSPRWRGVAWVLVVSFGGATLWSMFRPGPIDLSVLQVPNPVGIQALDRLVGAQLQRLAGAWIFLVWVATLVAAVLAPWLRWRRSGPEERQQLKWLAFVAIASLLTAAAGLVLTVVGASRAVADFVLVAALMGLGLGVPVAVGVAILKHRLYQIDRIINRSLVYAILTACLAGAYILLVSLLGALFSTRAGLGPSLVATAVIALVFGPARQRVQLGVDRLLYGERRNPYKVLTQLARLEAPLTPEALLPDLVATVASALRLPYVAVELRQTGGTVTVAHGVVDAAALVLPLVHGNQPVGRLLVGQRAPGEPLTVAERRLLEDLARQITVVVYAVRLTSELQRARERLVLAGEEERRRLHRDLHDGLGPTLAGIVLGLDSARRALAGAQPAVGSLLDQLKAEVQAAVAETRRLVDGLRPPALDELGLVAALRKHAQGFGVGDQGVAVAVQAPDDLGGLPAAVEVAAYRIVLEALTNVRRHAHARRCQVQLGLDGGLRLEVRDDGRGLPADPPLGVGMASMRERATELGGWCTVGPAPGQGTSVQAWLPVTTHAG